MANNVLTNYIYYETNGTIKFKVTINNLSSYVYLRDMRKKQTYYTTGEITLDNYGPDQTIEYRLYSNLDYCKGNYINSFYVTLPPYNPYYKDSLCKGIENYKLCRKWYKMTLTYDEFKKEVTAYLYKSTEDKQKDLKDYKSIYEIVFDYYLKYYYIVLPAIIIVGLIVIIIKRRKEAKELEY